MPLRIDTFSNQVGGFSFFKAIGHPLTAAALQDLLDRIAAAGPVALYDPLGHVSTLAELYDLSELKIEDVYVQAVERLGDEIEGHRVKPIHEIGGCGAKTLLVAGFDATRAIDQIRHLLPTGLSAVSLDEARLPDAMLTNPRRYLDPLNFATNHGFLREGDGHHTRLVSANYWTGYGAQTVRLWCRLFDLDGRALGTWEQDLKPNVSGLVLDSREISARLRLDRFTGTLCVHAIGARGHDVVKYAVDTFGPAPDVLSCTHDANAWPADFYAGLPAAGPGERVTLWLQNAHPTPIAPGDIALNLMGHDDVRPIPTAIKGFGTAAIDPADLFPDAVWPAQFEIRAGKHVVRPRYEVLSGNRRSRIAHVNVERTDLKPDPKLAELSPHMGQGIILPAPILPTARYTSIALPTPMSTGQENLPIAAVLRDADGGA